MDLKQHNKTLESIKNSHLLQYTQYNLATTGDLGLLFTGLCTAAT